MLAVSVCLGALAGFAGGAVDAIIMRVVDVLLGLPGLVLALALVGTLGPSLGTLMLALTVAQAPWYIRLIRTMVLRERERPYVLVARVHGAGPVAIVWRHVLPAVLGQLAVLATLDLGSVVLAVAGLSLPRPGRAAPGRGVGGDAQRRAHHLRPAPPADGRAGVLHLLHRALRQPLGDALRDVLDPTWTGHRG